MERLFLTGKLTEPDPLNPSQSVTVVYQRVAPGLGNVDSDPTGTQQRRALVTPTDPRTPAQLARRAKMADAVAAWHAATPEQRAAYNDAARVRRITAFNAFVSAFLRF